ncbi:MAG: alpha-L-rhamnosidase C-terminal domain-containing protein [Rikenellaceae bacterium]
MGIKHLIISGVAVASISIAISKPTDLRVDYVRIPEQTKIYSQTPMLSWQLPQKAKAQSAYQIEVWSDEGRRVWQSDKVESDNSVAVPYDGEQLQGGDTYEWRVRYWDQRGKKSRYSEAQTFTVASDEQRSESIVTDNPVLSRKDSPMSRSIVGEGRYLYDFGRSAFGGVSFEMDVKSDATMVLRVGEQLSSEGGIEQKPQGTIRYYEVEVELKQGVSKYTVELPTDKRNTGSMAIPIPEEWGVIAPFRYLEVCDLGDNDIEDFNPYREVHYGYREPNGAFTSSDTLLDSIYNICAYTIEATDLLGYYIDGDRERIPYEADAYLNQLSHYCLDSEYAIGKKTLEYFMSHATWPTEWLLHTIMIAYQDYLHTADTRLISHYYDKLKAKTLYELGREDGLINAQSEVVTPQYLLSIGFKKGAKRMADIVDWPPAAFTKGVAEIGERDGHEMMPINTVVNAFHSYALSLMSEMALAIGKQEDSRLFAQRAQLVKESLNTKLFDEQRGIYIDGEGSTHSSLHSNMIPLAFGLVEQENVESVVEFVKSRGVACSVYGAQYLLEALYIGGEAQYALDLMRNRSDRGWYNMIRAGSTMTLEAWDIKYKGNLDWNHAWGAAPANIIPRYMWGVTPVEVGYKRAHIKPQLADIESSSLDVPTLNGVIRCTYSATEGAKHYTIDIPANMSATFEVTDDFKGITLNKRQIEADQFELTTGRHEITITL